MLSLFRLIYIERHHLISLILCLLIINTLSPTSPLSPMSTVKVLMVLNHRLNYRSALVNFYITAEMERSEKNKHLKKNIGVRYPRKKYFQSHYKMGPSVKIFKFMSTPMVLIGLRVLNFKSTNKSYKFIRLNLTHSFVNTDRTAPPNVPRPMPPYYQILKVIVKHTSAPANYAQLHTYSAEFNYRTVCRRCRGCFSDLYKRNQIL